MKKLAIFLIAIGGLIGLWSHSVFAANSTFSIDSLNASYYLDRDSQKVSTLVAEEVFSVSFGSGGSTGFTRSIPTKYLKNSNDLKVTGVVDTSGASVPYTSSYDGNHDLILKIGNPSITVFGSQSYTIRYQAKGVINFFKDHQEFFPNFNGRGWDTSFGSINAIIHLPNSLAGEMSANPECFIDSGKCLLEATKTDKDTIITVSSQGSVPAHQSMTAKIQFKNGTFKPYQSKSWPIWLKISAGVTVALFVMAVLRNMKSWRRKTKSSKKSARTD